jgi:heme/copper-type cytochrome/quinol oxidase subunit 2
MNPDFRKVALIAAALGLLVSLFFALRPDDDDGSAAQTTIAQTTTAETTTAETATGAPPTTTEEVTTEAPPTTTAAPEAVRINYVIVGGEPQGGIQRDSVARGRDVVITVTSDVADEVHVHGYDLMADVAPGAPATIRFTADAPGRFEIELENTGVQIAELEVRP